MIMNIIMLHFNYLGYGVICTSTGNEAMEAFRAKHVDYVISDYHLVEDNSELFLSTLPGDYENVSVYSSDEKAIDRLRDVVFKDRFWNYYLKSSIHSLIKLFNEVEYSLKSRGKSP